MILWLIGLGSAPIDDPPCRPTENAKVERMNGTVNRWAEPNRCPDDATWAPKLAWVGWMQREEYPAVGRSGAVRAAVGAGIRRCLVNF